jgi:hypothetical protein
MDEQMQQQQMEQGAQSPSPEQAMQSMEQERMAQIESIAAASPQIEKSINSSLVKKLVTEVKQLLC